jgi:hypothetical protein
MDAKRRLRHILWWLEVTIAGGAAIGAAYATQFGMPWLGLCMACWSLGTFLRLLVDSERIYWEDLRDE